MYTVLIIAAARPNFMKIAPLLRAFETQKNVRTILVHTGQHYDAKLSEIFFTELGIRNPDHYLGISGDTPLSQVHRVAEAVDTILVQHHIDLTIVVGDVNATLGAALASAMRNIPVAHVEAGLRSNDLSMPEERNRLATDKLSSLLFVTEKSATENLVSEGFPSQRIHVVGNTMIDTLVAQKDAFTTEVQEKLQLSNRRYAVATFHRPANVDSEQRLRELVQFLKTLAKSVPVVLPLHSRTKLRLNEYGLYDLLVSSGVRITEPLGYNEFLGLVQNAQFIVTDSGGIQEETTFLGVPCFTLRASTERPVTVTLGTNKLVPTFEQALAAINDLLAGHKKQHEIPPLWDGNAAQRIVSVIVQFLQEQKK